VLGDLTEQEKAEFERKLLEFPELKDELLLVEETQQAFLMRNAINPPTALKEKLFKKIDAPEVRVISIPKDNASILWRYATAASIALALVTSYLAYNYWGKWKEVSADLTTLASQNQQMAQGYNQVNQQLAELEKDIHIMDDPGFQRVIMKGTANANEALASVYWNQSTQEVYLRIHNMKELSQENHYQLWAIIDGKPVDAGLFDKSVNGLIKMKNIGQGAATFAVTIEPRGGSEAPHLETMQVAGNVDKG
jgi:anti-sigma-K factor RskA